MEKMSPIAKRKQEAKRRRERFEFIFICGARWYRERSFAERKV
jgi:lysyl-tRNA synthetase class II